MKAEKLEWFPLYVSDLLTSRKMRTMLPEERGWYVLLLCHEWDGGPLPKDMDEMGTLLGIDGDRMARAWLRLGRAFTETPAGYINERLERVRAEQADKFEVKSRAGKKGAESRWGERENGNRIATAMTTGMQDKKREEENTAAAEEKGSGEEEAAGHPLDKTAYALGEFCRTVGCIWPNKVPIAEWSATLDAEPAFAGLDIPLEIRSCADWLVSNRRIPKAPGPTIRNWLKNARRSARQPDGGGGGRTFKQVESDCKALLRAAGNMVLVEVARAPIFERLAKELPDPWKRSGDVFQGLDFPPLVKAPNEFAQSESLRGQLERLSGHRRSA